MKNTKTQVSCEWVVKERVESGVWVVRTCVKNLFTTYGLTAFASALSGAYTYPQYLAIESFYATPTKQINSGDTSIFLSSRIDVTGDSQIVLGLGTANQETVPFTTVTGSGPFVYTVPNGATRTHVTTDPCCRVPLTTDTVSQLSHELEYDSTNFPGQRMQSPGGYSPGSGQWTVQFYYPGGTAQGFIALAGLTDNATIGSGNLHNHFLVGFSNTNPGNDVELDGTLTIVNG